MSRTLTGILLQLAALILFVGMDTLVKQLTASYPVPQLMWARFVFSLLVVTLAMWLLGGRRRNAVPWRSRAPRQQAVRSLLLAGANLMFSSALVYVPLADVTAVGFASPLITVALAALWLRETVSLRRWAGVLLGMAGVLLALQPPFLTGGPAPHWAAVLPLGTAMAFAMYQILTRRLATVDDPRTTILHTGFAASLVCTLALPFFWVSPSLADWGVLALLGVLGGAGHGLLVLAFARAPVSLLSPLSYTQMIWAMLSGLLVFGDRPAPAVLLGAAVIAAGGVLVAWPARRAGQGAASSRPATLAPEPPRD